MAVKFICAIILGALISFFIYLKRAKRKRKDFIKKYTSPIYQPKRGKKKTYKNKD